MRVFYPGPGPKTYHPKLGKMITGRVFDLDMKTANKYIKSGLLKKAPIIKKTKKKTEVNDNG